VRDRSTTAAGIAVRGLALFMAAFTIVGLVGEARGRATDIGLWFVDLRDLGRPAEIAILAILGGALLAWVLSARPDTFQRRATAIVCLVVGAFAARDVVRFAQVVASGIVRPTQPIPLSLLVALGLALLGLWTWRDRGREPTRPGRARVAVAAAALATAVAFPVVQIGFFGTTDYRRPADAAVILGARVYADGRPSPLLADRIATGVDLYRSGLVPLLVMSGGDGADGFNEAVVMRERAIAAGVAPTAILVDASGVNTDATVEHAIALLAAPSAVQPLRLIAVSQPYHLPRIQLAFSGAGIDVLTVPAVDPVPISEMPLLIAREIPAFWLYYLRACLG
jgi:vancomycin permeability regulator SanA